MRSVIFREAFVLATLAVFGMVLAACEAQARDPIDLVPARSEILVSVDLPAILADGDVRELYEMVVASRSAQDDVPATLGELLAKAEEETGLDFASFGEALMFADLPSAGDMDAGMDSENLDYFGFIAAGAPADLMETLGGSEHAELTEGEYSGIATLGDEEMLIAVVDGAAVFGSPEAVQDVIDVAENGAATVSGELLDLYESLGDTWMTLAVTLSQDLQDEIEEAAGSGAEGMPVDLGGVFGFDAVGVSADKVETDGILRVVMRYGSADEAQEAQETIDALITLFEAFGGGDEQMMEALESLEISVDDTDLIFEVTEDLQQAMDQIREALDTYGDPSVFMGPGL